MDNGGGQKAKRVRHFYIESAHQRIDFAEGVGFAPPRRGTCPCLALYAEKKGQQL